MMTHRAHDDRSPAGRRGSQRLLPIAGISVAVVAVLVHLAGGAGLMHLGLGADVASLSGGALLVGLAAVITLKLLLLFVLGREGIVGGTRMLAHRSTSDFAITTGKTIRRAHLYEQ